MRIKSGEGSILGAEAGTEETQDGENACAHKVSAKIPFVNTLCYMPLQSCTPKFVLTQTSVRALDRTVVWSRVLQFYKIVCLRNQRLWKLSAGFAKVSSPILETGWLAQCM